MKFIFPILNTCLLLCTQAFAAATDSRSEAMTAGDKPNIIVILADDLGYGDLQCYNPQRGKIPTPHIDKLAAQGMRFTDGHSSSSVCTPSRYALLTGRYHWRTHLQRSVLGGMSPPLIAPDRLTLASLLKQHGYATACIGKWHLGMTMPKPLTEGSITNGPITHGFDYYYGISASLDMPPYAFIENDRFTEPPTATKTLLMVGKDHTEPRIGPAAPGFESEQALPKFVETSVDWMKKHQDHPFFLYLALNSPHTPLAPTPAWKGKSGLGDYADFVMQTDAAVGEIMAALDEMHATQNTLVILTSDNGPASYVGTKVNADPRDSHDRNDAIKDLEAMGHYPAGPLRGYKGSVLEGGHRVPFVVRWPSVVKAGGVSGQLVHQADLIRTFADAIDAKLPDTAGEDSFSLMPLLKGEDKPIREHAICANAIPTLRLGAWKYIPSSVQLYNIADDLGETKNLAATMPDKVVEMKTLLEKLIAEGRSTPGAAQKNDVEVKRYPGESTGTKSWPLSDERINYLLVGDVCESVGLKETIDGRKRFGVNGWKKKEQVFQWPVQSSKAGTSQISLLVSAPVGTALVLQSHQETKELVVMESGWSRIPATLDLGNGADVISLKLKESLTGKIEAGLMSIEVITEKFCPAYEKQLADLKASPGDCAWFQNAGFGLMFQWGSWGYPKTGDRKSPWPLIYQEFDIDAFADKMKSLNPGYIVWSITWRGSRFSAPLKSVEQIMGSKDYTMEYDFLGRLADALHKRNIPMFLYYHPGAEEPAFWAKMWHGQDNRQPWEDANVAIWTEIGNRLGNKLAGWFIDAGMVQHYPADFHRYKQALRAGNPKRLTTFNPWRFPKVSPYDDMSFGEDKAPGSKKEGVFVDGPNAGLMAHTMMILDGPAWGIFKKNTVIKKPRWDASQLQTMIHDAKRDKHPLSFCILMYEDGSLGEETEAVLKQIKR